MYARRTRSRGRRAERTLAGVECVESAKIAKRKLSPIEGKRFAVTFFACRTRCESRACRQCESVEKKQRLLHETDYLLKKAGPARSAPIL